MPQRDPKCRRHKRKGRADTAEVELNGRCIHLGIYDTPESWEKYHRILAEWNANGRRLPVEPEDITIVELIGRYWDFAQSYYRKPDGTPTGEADNIRYPLRDLRTHYGKTLAADFTPQALKRVRARMVESRIARSTVNKRVGMIRRMFRWAVAEGLVPPTTYEALRALPDLRRGRSKARETERVRPVEQEHIDAVRDHVSRQVWALIQLQLLTAARSGELLTMRPCDLDQSGKVWLYRPPQHKTEHHDHQRVIFVGPRGQEVLRPFQDGRSSEAPIFSPQEAEQERRKAMHERRVTPLEQGNRPGTNRKRRPETTPGEFYTTASYRRAVQRGCIAAGVPKWHPHQLRHNAATFLRREFGLDVARIILGHRSAAVSDMYAELDAKKALKAIARIG